MIGKIARASILAVVISAATAGVAAAGSAYDGRWSLSIVTQRGGCDAYNFPVQIANGQTLLRTAPHLVLAPGIAILVAVAAFNLLGEGLRDALDARDTRDAAQEAQAAQEAR